MKLSDKLKLRHMEVFVEVARQKSVSGAARALHLSQPAVSRTMRELEEVCGKPLLEREGRGVCISAFGEIFLQHAGASLIAAREGMLALSSLDDEAAPPVRIGTLPTVSATFLPEAVAAFRSEGRSGRLTIATGENSRLLDQMRDGRLDMVIGRMHSPEDMLGLTFEPIYREPVVMVVHRSHPLAPARQITSDDLDQHMILLPSHESVIRPAVERLFTEQGFMLPANAIETVSDSFGRRFTRKFGAIWVVSRGVVTADLDEGIFRALPVDTSSTSGPVGVSTRADIPLSPAAARFMALLRRLSAEQLAA